MILAEKIQNLRKKHNMSQESLAEKCGVSRQSISKWEADIALPEVDKLLLLSKIFSVSIDYLLIDSMTVDETKTIHSCSVKCDGAISHKEVIFEGIIIKESIKDEDIFDEVKVQKVEFWKTSGRPKYWTAIFFTAKGEDFPKHLSVALKSEEEGGINWFTDMKREKIKYIVFNKEILSYEIGDVEGRKKVCEACRKLGIPEEQMDWED